MKQNRLTFKDCYLIYSKRRNEENRTFLTTFKIDIHFIFKPKILLIYGAKKNLLQFSPTNVKVFNKKEGNLQIAKESGS